MASSNRHWPSLFKSKPSCTAAHHQWQHDINHSPLLSGHCQKPNSYASGSEERNPEPKPRWNPKPEQIRILEAIFNSGMVNPPRDEIRRIRAQLQVYGQVGDANVFYWFQNRKSRSKHKQRHLKSTATAASAASRSTPTPSSTTAVSVTAPPPSATTSSSTSSSDRSSSSGSNKQILPLVSTPPLSAATAGSLAAFFDLSQSPAPSVNQTFFHAPLLIPELSLEASVYLPTIPSTYPLPSVELSGGIEAGSPSLWGDLIMQEVPSKIGAREEEVVGFNKLGVVAALGSVTDTAPPPLVAHSSANVTSAIGTPSPVNEIQVARSMVFINEVAYEVMAGPLNIWEAFGEDAILLHSSGHPVLTDEWGLTLHPLQHGASYYLVQ